jgi:hypothetical protein
MSKRFASCTCGQLTATVDADPVRISICHCLACQRRSGSVFAAQARFPRDGVGIAGASTTYVRTGDAGTRATFHFCATCGDTVYYEMDAFPDFLAIPIGAFADPGFPAPRVSVYESRKHAWVVPPAEAEHFP